MSTQDRALLFNSLWISMVGHGRCQASTSGVVGYFGLYQMIDLQERHP
jgi:hypothetical protein